MKDTITLVRLVPVRKTPNINLGVMTEIAIADGWCDRIQQDETRTMQKS